LLFFVLVTGLFVVLIYPVLFLPIPGTVAGGSSVPSVIQVWLLLIQKFRPINSKNGRKSKRGRQKNILSRLRHPAAYFLRSGGGESTPPDGESDEFEYMLRDNSDSEPDISRTAWSQRMFNRRGRSSTNSSLNFPLAQV
jgi:hypothetical protein